MILQMERGVVATEGVEAATEKAVKEVQPGKGILAISLPTQYPGNHIAEQSLQSIRFYYKRIAPPSLHDPPWKPRACRSLSLLIR